MNSSDPQEHAAQEWFRKGTDALQKENFKYAAECFGTSAKMKPDNLLYRQCLAGVIDRMDGDDDLPGA